MSRLPKWLRRPAQFYRDTLWFRSDDIDAVYGVDNLFVVANLGQLAQVQALIRFERLENNYLLILYTDANTRMSALVRDNVDEQLFGGVSLLWLPRSPNTISVKKLVYMARAYKKRLAALAPERVFLLSFDRHYAVLASLATRLGCRLALVEEGTGTYALRRVGKNIVSTRSVRLHRAERLATLCIRYMPGLRHLESALKPFVGFDDVYVAFPNLARQVFSSQNIHRFFLHAGGMTGDARTRQLVHRYQITSNDVIYVNQRYAIDPDEHAGAIVCIAQRIAKGLSCRVFIKMHPKDSARLQEAFCAHIARSRQIGRIVCIREHDFLIEPAIAVARPRGVVGIASTSLVYAPLVSKTTRVYSIAPAFLGMVCHSGKKNDNKAGAAAISAHLEILKRFEHVMILPPQFDADDLRAKQTPDETGEDEYGTVLERLNALALCEAWQQALDEVDKVLLGAASPHEADKALVYAFCPKKDSEALLIGQSPSVMNKALLRMPSPTVLSVLKMYYLARLGADGHNEEVSSLLQSIGSADRILGQVARAYADFARQDFASAADLLEQASPVLHRDIKWVLKTDLVWAHSVACAGRHDDALTIMQMYRSYAPEDDAAWFLAGARIAALRGQWQKAACHVGWAFPEGPAAMPAVIGAELFYVLLMLGSHEAAADVWNHAIPKYLNQYGAKAIQTRAAVRTPEARWLQAADAALDQLGRRYVGRAGWKMLDEAVQVLRLNGGICQDRFQRARAMLALAEDDWLLALDALDALTLTGCVSENDRVHRCICLGELGDQDGFRVALGSLADTDCTLPNTVLLQVYRHVAVREWVAAANVLAGQLGVFDGPVNGWLEPAAVLARAYRMAGDLSSAKSCLEAAPHYAGHDGTGVRKEAVLLAHAEERWEDVAVMLEAMHPGGCDGMPEWAVVAYSLALRRRGRLDKAGRFWGEAIHVKDLGVEARLECARCKILLGEWKEAARMAKTALAQSEDAPWVMAAACREGGMIDEAYRLLSLTTTRPASTPDELMLLADMAHLTGNWRTAADAWKAMLCRFAASTPAHAWGRLFELNMLCVADDVAALLRRG